MANLIAYIPVLNQRHIDWFRKHDGSNLFLISQEMAEGFLPRLARNMAALPTQMVADCVRTLHLIQGVAIFDPSILLFNWGSWIMADEDVSHRLAEKYFHPKDVTHKFEMIWARWDMTAVHREQPVIADVVVSRSDIDYLKVNIAFKKAKESPDWWRQIGAIAFSEAGKPLAMACNTHMPNEYETYIFGDPRLNVDAGQPGKYVVLHAERAVIAMCAQLGRALEGASLYITTFPCEDCAREIAFAGVKRVFFREGYSVLNAQEVLRSYGVEIVQVVEEPGSA